MRPCLEVDKHTLVLITLSVALRYHIHPFNLPKAKVGEDSLYTRLRDVGEHTRDADGRLTSLEGGKVKMLNCSRRHDVLVCNKTSESHEEFVDTLTELSKKYFNFLQKVLRNEFTKKNRLLETVMQFPVLFYDSIFRYKYLLLR